MLPLSLLIAALVPPCALFVAQEEAVSAPSPTQETVIHTQAPPQIRLNSGRVTLLRPGDRQILIGSEPSMEAPRAAHLEAGAGASLNLTWSGRASLHLTGPASMEWSESSDGTPEWHVFSAGSLNLEVRRGQPRLHLPGDWRAQIDGVAALYLETGTDGVAWVDCDAGEALAFRWMGDPSKARPAVFCAPGTSVRLGEPPEPDARATRIVLPAWERAAWAWPEWSESALPEGEEPQPTSLGAALRRHSMHSRAIAKADPDLPAPLGENDHRQRTNRDGGPGADVRTASPLRFSARRPIDRLARRGGASLGDGILDEQGAPVVLPADGESERTFASVSAGGLEGELKVTVQPQGQVRTSASPWLDLPVARAQSAPEISGLADADGGMGAQSELSLPQAGREPREQESLQENSSIQLPAGAAERPIAQQAMNAEPAAPVPSIPESSPPAEPIVEPELQITSPEPANELALSLPDSAPATQITEGQEVVPAPDDSVVALPDRVEEVSEPAALELPETPGAERQRQPAEPQPVEPEAIEPSPSEEETPAPKEPAVFHVQDWHYLKRDRIRRVAGFAVQDHPALSIEEQPGDLWRITLRADASANAWVLGTRKDLLLRPGAVVVLKPNGDLDAHFGRVRFDDVPEWRPTWSELAPVPSEQE